MTITTLSLDDRTTIYAEIRSLINVTLRMQLRCERFEYGEETEFFAMLAEVRENEERIANLKMILAES